MKYKKQVLVIASMAAFLTLIQCTKTLDKSENIDSSLINEEKKINEKDESLINEGKNIFRYDAFGDEDFWSGVLHLDKAIAGSNKGGFGAGVSPGTALAVGLKVDAEALPPDIIAEIKSGKVNLNDPATTLALLRLNAVVGVKGNFSSEGKLSSIGITCAVCHSTVDNSFAQGIGKRLDG